MGHQIDRLGGAPDENNLAARARIDEANQPVPCAFVQRRGLLAQGMNAAMDVGVVVTFVVIHCVDDTLGPLGRGAIVQIGQWLAVHHASQYRELAARGIDVEGTISVG